MKSETPECHRAPSGWKCKLERDHLGPCAAYRDDEIRVGLLEIKPLFDAMPPDLQKRFSCHDLKRTVDHYNEEKEQRVELAVCHLEDGMLPFIYSVSGRVDLEQLKIIEESLVDDDYADKFAQGFGEYLIYAYHQHDHWDYHGDIPVVTFKAHWELSFEKFTPYDHLSPSTEEETE